MITVTLSVKVKIQERRIAGVLQPLADPEYIVDTVARALCDISNSYEGVTIDAHEVLKDKKFA